MDAHAVQLFSLDLPSYNPMLWKWILPNSLDQCTVDHASLADQADHQVDLIQKQVSEHIDSSDMNAALALWSQKCENLLAQFSLTHEGVAPTHKRFLGRAQHVHPVKRALTAPRFKQGRQGNFCASAVVASLEVRQVQRQARRLQSLIRTRSCAFFGPVQMCGIVGRHSTFFGF